MKRVLLTRAAEDNARWAERLRAADIEPVELACLRCEVLPGRAPELERALAGAAWLALTSRRGAAAVASLTGGPPEGVAVAAVGPATAAEARASLGRCDLVAPRGDARSLAAAIAERAPPAAARVVIAGARDGLADLRDGLTDRAVKWAFVPVYRTLPAAPAPRRARPAVDAVFLASPSAVEGLTALAEIPPTAAVIALGPRTRAAALAAGLEVAAQARGRDLASMLEAWRSLPTDPPEPRPRP
ncbi:MAG: uroporphyrinogen-III synthase [Planctomycetota bacterium]|jgi:uroporphyrinogen-III synthase|nr:uroporphyrinogen-III synthase [Planctomycetota bacterium]MDP6762921.1 uroporphyrinogen-III synthase [Planctomycetota bacterium]MDP6988617.1 uroporphyrinogen-III synthase [Planctomycetota bacterium]